MSEELRRHFLRLKIRSEGHWTSSCETTWLWKHRNIHKTDMTFPLMKPSRRQMFLPNISWLMVHFLLGLFIRNGFLWSFFSQGKIIRLKQSNAFESRTGHKIGKKSRTGRISTDESFLWWWNNVAGNRWWIRDTVLCAVLIDSAGPLHHSQTPIGERRWEVAKDV